MKDRPVPALDPEKLRRERKTADLGSSEETKYTHVDEESGSREPGGAHEKPTSGPTPPAR